MRRWCEPRSCRMGPPWLVACMHAPVRSDASQACSFHRNASDCRRALSQPTMKFRTTTGSAVFAKGVVALGMLLMCCPGAAALDPSLDVSQYAHTAWNFRQGFSKSRVTSFAQTPDGYLWLGTEFGLLRFDGVRPSHGCRLEMNNFRTTDRSSPHCPDGTLWIGTFRGLASLKNGRLIQYPALAGQASMHSWWIMKERYGLAGVSGVLARCARFKEAAHDATERAAVWASGWPLSVRIAAAISGWRPGRGRGDGGPGISNVTRSSTP